MCQGALVSNWLDKDEVNRIRAKLCGEALQFIKGHDNYPEMFNEFRQHQ